jgi:hypothetical protein
MLLRLSAAVLGLAILGCGESQGVADPTPAGNGTVMETAGRTKFVVLPGEAVAWMPSVIVRLAGVGTGVPGTTVTFSFENGTSSSVVTDAKGFATLPTWPLDYTKSEERVIATAPGISGYVTFKTFILHKTILAFYDLQSVGGKAPPLAYPSGGFSFDITGAHYVLFADGTYISGFEIHGKTEWSQLQLFVKRSSSFDFYLNSVSDPDADANASNNYLLSTGTLSGNVMTVKYQDTYDYQEETYRQR